MGSGADGRLTGRRASRGGILVHECVSGGGFGGRPVAPSLAREGTAMRDALVTDLAALGHRIVTTADLRFPLRGMPRGVEVVALPPGNGALLDGLLASAEAAWLVAPESGGVLEALAARAEAHGVALLGPDAAAIRRASDKGALPARLARRGIAHPETHVVESDRQARRAAAAVGFPLVVKPSRGAGSVGVTLVRGPAALAPALASARRAAPGDPLLVQRHVEGVPASVSLVAAGGRAVALAVHAQVLGRGFSYRGGLTPLRHPLALLGARAAERACADVRGLRGYVGVDLVLTGDEAVVIEMNPRLTTSYLGLRRAIDASAAELALAACAGRLPKAPPLRRRVGFSAAGRILSTRPLPRRGGA